VAANYEVTYILRPDIEEAEFDARIDGIAERLKASGAEVVSVEKIGKRRLAYEIHDVREGFYVTMNFKSDAEQAKELERQLRLSEDIMRTLLVKLDRPAPVPPPASAPA
jgi:small subunit ribosomal protein S6